MSEFLMGRIFGSEGAWALVLGARIPEERFRLPPLALRAAVRPILGAENGLERASFMQKPRYLWHQEKSSKVLCDCHTFVASIPQ